MWNVTLQLLPEHFSGVTVQGSGWFTTYVAPVEPLTAA
jgi:hypothetical protein